MDLQIGSLQTSLSQTGLDVSLLQPKQEEALFAPVHDPHVSLHRKRKTTPSVEEEGKKVKRERDRNGGETGVNLMESAPCVVSKSVPSAMRVSP